MKKLITIIFLLTALLSAGQAPVITNLAFEGGGIRGIAYAGVLKVLEKEGVMDSIRQVAGTSVGAITALAVALNYSADDIYNLITRTKFSDFNDGEYLFAGGIYRLNKNFGWYKHDKFEAWLNRVIAKKTGNPNITFEEMHRKGYKDLYITGTCMNTQKLIVFSYKNYPRMRVKDAVMISMSVPVYFEAMLMDASGKIYKERNDTVDLMVMVDGGVLGNYPVFVFDSTYTDSLGNEIRIPNPHTPGVRVDFDRQIDEEYLEINNFEDYLITTYILLLENMNCKVLKPYDWSRTITVSAVGTGPRVRNLSRKQISLLVNSGKRATKYYLKTR